ncbi:MAG TPA: hypothetical protein VGL62_04690, partial [Vicinamibacterales bacterium]
MLQLFPRRGLLALFLALLVAALNVAVFMSLHPGDRGEEDEAHATYARAALDQRMEILAGRSRRIAPGSWMRAKGHVDRMRKRRDAARLSSAGSAAAASSEAVSLPTSVTSPSAAATWRWLGPNNIGGRIRTIAITPANPTTIFAGSASGGIWKSTDSGASWTPVDDFMSVLSVSSIVFDPTNPSVMYAGTGEGYDNIDAIRGDGIFKSTDSGSTWTQLASTAGTTTVDNFAFVDRVAISPDGQIILTANGGAGVFRSTNGGATFTQTATFAAETVVIDPADGSKALAAPQGAIHYTTDGGQTWHLSSGLPAGGRIELAYAPGNPLVVYASYDYHNGSLFRSNDGGVSFTLVHDGSDEPLLGAQGWYDNVIWVNPTNVNDVIVGGVDMYESLDGGTTWPNEIGRQMHADHHAIVADPRFGAANRTVYFGSDGGMFKIDDLGEFATSPPYAINNNLGVTQFYGAAADPSTGIVVGGTQDNGTDSFSPSTSLGWFIASAGDGGFAASDPSRSGLFYGEHQYLTLFRATNGGHTDVSFIDGGLSDANHDALFIAPFVLDPNNPQRMLAGGLTLWRTPDATVSSPTWTGIKASRSGSDHVSAIAIAPGNSNIIWVGYE